MTRIEVKVISGHQVKKANKIRDIELQYLHVFRSDVGKESKKDPETLFEASKLVKKKKMENHVPKSREKMGILTCDVSENNSFPVSVPLPNAVRGKPYSNWVIPQNVFRRNASSYEGLYAGIR